MAESGRGCVNAIVCIDRWEFRVPGQDADGALCLRFGLLGGWGAMAIAKSIFSGTAQLLLVARWLKSNRIEAINFHYVGLSGLSIAVLKWLRIFRGRFVLSFHGTDLQLPDRVLERLLYRFMLSRADSVTFCSHALADRAVSMLLGNRDRFNVIYNGVDTNVFKPNLAKDPSLPAMYLVQVGSFDIRKRQLFLLECFSRIAPSYPGLSLVLVGMDGPERSRVLKWADERGLAKCLVVRTDLEPRDVARIVANAVCCVQPSSVEAFGIAVIEAGACRVPVVASRVGGHIETVIDEVNGLLFEVDDIDGCVKAIERLLESDSLRARLATAFYQKVVDNFKWSESAKKYFELLRGT
ncbi:MAG: glycosyltransferase family 4 protein [Zoogloeaceae bacterium]|nr:glycosyltransferase family 4 protein [Zoogloeaceae bacterium]